MVTDICWGRNQKQMCEFFLKLSTFESSFENPGSTWWWSVPLCSFRNLPHLCWPSCTSVQRPLWNLHYVTIIESHKLQKRKLCLHRLSFWSRPPFPSLWHFPTQTFSKNKKIGWGRKKKKNSRHLEGRLFNSSIGEFPLHFSPYHHNTMTMTQALYKMPGECSPLSDWGK